MTGRRILLFVTIGIAALVVVAGAGFFIVQQRIKGQIEDGWRQLAANPPPPYRTFAYDKVEFSLLDRRVVVHGLKAEPGDNGESLSAGRLELARFDVGVWQQAIGPKPEGAAPDATFRRLFDKAVFTDIVAVQGGQPAKADRLTIAGVEIRPIPSQVIATFRALSPTERMKETLSYVRIESTVLEGVRGMSGGRELVFARGEIQGLRDDRFKSLVFEKLEQDQPDGRLTLGRLELRDGLSSVWFSPVESKTAEEKLAYFDFSALKMADLRKGDILNKESGVVIEAAEIGPVSRSKLDNLVIRGITINDKGRAEPLTVKMANMELRDLDWEQVLPIVAALIESDSKTGGAGGLPPGLDQIGKARYSLGKLSLTGMDFGPGITLAETTMRFRNDNGTGDFDFAMTDLIFKAAELRDQQFAAGLLSFGYSNLNLSMRARAVGSREAATGGLEKFEIYGPQVGKFFASYFISNFKEPALGASNPMAALLMANIDRIEVGWQDDGLTQKLLAAAAQQQRASVGQLKAGLAVQLRQMMLPYQNSTRMVDVAEAAIRYLEKPGTLTLSAKPTKPVSVSSMMALIDVPPPNQPDLPALFDLLEITATTR